MEKKVNSVLKVLIADARRGKTVSDIFDLMYETSLDNCELKNILEELISQNEAECIDVRTYKFVGDICREIEDEEDDGDKSDKIAYCDDEENEQNDGDFIEQKLADLKRRRAELFQNMRGASCADTGEAYGDGREDDDNNDNDLFSDDEDDDEEEDSDDGENLQSKLIEILTSQSEYGKLLARALKLCASEGNVSERMLADYLNIQESTADEVCFWLYLNDFIEQDENKGYKLAVPESLFYACCIEARERKEHVGTIVDVLKSISAQKQREEEDSKIKALILSDISLNRTKTLVKAQGCLFASQNAGNDIYVSIYKNIIYKLSNMSDYTFNKLKKQLSG